MLRARKIITLVIPANQGCQMGIDRYFLIAIGVMGNGRAIDENDVAVVYSELLIEHAADDPVTRTQPLDPYCLLQSRIIEACAAFCERSLGNLDLGVRIRALG